MYCRGLREEHTVQLVCASASEGPAGPQNRRPVQEDIQALASIPKPACRAQVKLWNSFLQSLFRLASLHRRRTPRCTEEATSRAHARERRPQLAFLACDRPRKVLVMCPAPSSVPTKHLMPAPALVATWSPLLLHHKGEKTAAHRLRLLCSIKTCQCPDTKIHNLSPCTPECLRGMHAHSSRM